MKYMSEQEYEEQLEKIQEKNATIERKRKLKEEKKKGKQTRKLPSTSKIALFSIILLCVEIIIFCEYAMLRLYDISAMYVLVGIPAALAPTLWGYYSKSKAENTVGGIVYDTAMAQLEVPSPEDVGIESEESADGAVG